MTFPLVGNLKIKESLQNAISEKRLPHALLIEGAKGTGRHTLASYITMATVCSDMAPPCKVCNNCKLASASNHPDIIVVAPEDGKKNISVAQIRNLRTETFVKPHTSQRKVFVIDFADTLNEQSQNALLKILEEPPEAVSFILIAESKASFLDTIISRCVCLTLSTPEFEAASKYLQEATEFSKSDIETALKSAHNNIGVAFKLLSGVGDTQSALAAKKFLSEMEKSNLWGMLSALSEAEKNRLNAMQFFKDLKYFTVNNLKQSLNSFKAKRLSSFYSYICELEKTLDSNINLSLLSCLLVSGAQEINK